MNHCACMLMARLQRIFMSRSAETKPADMGTGLGIPGKLHQFPLLNIINETSSPENRATVQEEAHDTGGEE